MVIAQQYLTFCGIIIKKEIYRQKHLFWIEILPFGHWQLIVGIQFLFFEKVLFIAFPRRQTLDKCQL